MEAKVLAEVKALMRSWVVRQRAGNHSSREALRELREFAADRFGFLSVALAMAIVVLVPVVLNTEMVSVNPVEAYYPPKFGVLMWLSQALLVAMLVFVVLRGRPLVVPVLVPTLAFLGVSALSTLLSENPTYSLLGDRNEGLLSLAAGVVLFYAMARCLDSPLRMRLFLAAGVTAAVLVSIYAISQNYGLDPISGWEVSWYTEFGRPFATIGNPVTLASYLTLMIGAAAALCFEAGSLSGRVPWLLALAVIGAGWIYTDTRGAMLGAGVALPVILWAAHRRMGTLRPLLVPLVTLVAAMGTAIMASAAFGNLSLSVSTLALLGAYLILIGGILWLSGRRPGVLRPLLVALAALMVAATIAIGVAAASGNLSLVEGTATERAGSLSSQVRLEIWRDTIPVILERPLLGHGPDNFRGPFEPHMSADLEAAITSGGQVAEVDRAHNDLLQVAATTGLVGLAAYLWIFVSYFRNAYRYGGWPLITLSGGVLAYVLQIQTSFPTISTSVAFWGLLGASVAMMRLQDRESNEQNQETGSVGRALIARRAGVYELLLVVVVVGTVAAIAVPKFLDQRAEAAQLARSDLILNVQQAVFMYEQAGEGNYPEAGVYTTTDPLRGAGSSFRPSENVTITTTTSANDFTVEGKSTSLSGTFRYSYDSATGKYTTPP